MADLEDVEQFLTEFAPDSKGDLQPEVKDDLRGLIEQYENYSYTKEQLAEVIEARVDGTLQDASADELATAVADILQPEVETAAETAAETSGETEEQWDIDAVYEYLGAELAADARAEIEATKQEFFAYLTEQLSAAVRAEIAAELAESADEWDSLEEAKAAAYEPAYAALKSAIDGLFDAGTEEGGFAELLSRPKS